jgi:hypothetical protein
LGWSRILVSGSGTSFFIAMRPNVSYANSIRQSSSALCCTSLSA